ncbi:MAG: hypothetical protein LW720_10900 [Pirellula sp.]|jgi:hypothetical protein|nr:hypothetical protein [Pirellula sp.]
MVSVVLQVTEEHWTRAANLSSKASPIDSDLSEILTLWNNLDESARRDLLGGARRLNNAATEPSS